MWIFFVLFFVLASFHQKYILWFAGFVGRIGSHQPGFSFVFCFRKMLVLIIVTVLCRIFLPNTAFTRRIHFRSSRTVISLGEILRVGERTDNADYSGRVHRASDLRECILRSHRAAPDLGVVEEEELVVGQIKSRQVGLLAVRRHPLSVSSKALL